MAIRVSASVVMSPVRGWVVSFLFLREVRLLRGGGGGFSSTLWVEGKNEKKVSVLA